MKRMPLIAVICLACVNAVRAQDAAEQATIAYVQKLQTSTGGFLTMAPQPNIRLAPTLRATSAAIRALHYLGGKIPNKKACEAFVASCYHSDSGGFSDMPAGKPDVFTTAVGLMAVTGLDLPTEKYGTSAIQFLAANVRGFEDIRIAVAGLERLERKSPKAQEWLMEVVKLRNEDGTFGKGLGQARFTGGAVVSLLRLGEKIEESAKIVQELQAGQRRNGGFGKDSNEVDSDLETSYRVMRCFMMLKARPSDVEGLRSFVAKCRNEDGGYGIAPGQPSTVGATYFAAIIKHWLDAKK